MVSRLLGAFGGGGASLGSAVLDLRTDNSGLNRGLEEGEQRTQRFGRIGSAAVAGVGVAAVTAAAMAIRSYADAGDAVQKMAQRTGLATEAVSELKHAADLSGSSIDELEGGFRRMQRTIVDADAGLASAVESLDMVGLKVEDLIGLDPDAQFMRIAGAIAQVDDETRKAAAAQEIFGRSGTALLPMLADGAAGLQAMRDEAHELGIVFDQEAADKAAAFNDSLTRLNAKLDALKYQFASVAIPAAEDMVQTFDDLLTVVHELIALPPIELVFNFVTGEVDLPLGLSFEDLLAGTPFGLGATYSKGREAASGVPDWFRDQFRVRGQVPRSWGLADEEFGGPGPGRYVSPEERERQRMLGIDWSVRGPLSFEEELEVNRAVAHSGALFAGRGASAAGSPAIGARLAEAEHEIADQFRVAAERLEAVERRALEVRENELQRWADALAASTDAIEEETAARGRAIQSAASAVSGLGLSADQQVALIQFGLDVDAAYAAGDLGTPG